MEKLTNGRDTFEIVESVPYNRDYVIWNIGKNMTDGYLPLVQTGGYNGCCVNTNTMKAIKVKEAQTILAAIGWGQGTIKKMETYIEKHKNSNEETTKAHIEKLKNALKIMYTIKGVENLR